MAKDAFAFQAPKRILVPVDLGPTSSTLAAFASDFALTLGAKLTLMHVWEPPPFSPVESLYIVVGDDRRTLADHVRDEGKDELGRILAGSDQVVDRKVALGDASANILAEVESGQHDLLIIGTHGRTGLTHLALGSVAEKVLRRCPVPVLVVPTAARKEASR